VKNYVLSWIKDGLRDWDITRDLHWGIPIPVSEAEGKVFYGWFDNHLCYISSTISYFTRNDINGKEFWNSAEIYHFIGKDIVYHHYLFLPAMRMGVNMEYKLPDHIPTRGHLMLHGNKFSKSRGWYVGLRKYLDNFPADYLRYYLATITPFSQSDVNFDWNDFQARINNELVANIGNFIHRTLNFISSRHQGEVPTPEEYDKMDLEFETELLNITEKVNKYLEKNEFDRALKNIIDFSANCNRYFQHREPWKGGKGSKTCLYLSVNAVKTLAILLDPYLSFSIEPLWRQLNIKVTRKWNLASTIDIAPGHNIGKPKILFRKLENSEIQKQKDKLAKANPRVKLSEKELLTRNSTKKKTMTEASFDDFTRLDFRIGRVVKANYLEGSEKLLKVQVNIGKEKCQAIAGLAEHYSPEDLINQLVAVIVNLQPRKIFGEVSEVMLLAAVDGSKVSLLNPDKEVSEGSKVT
jgi:methionyl-tRNA synthetase